MANIEFKLPDIGEGVAEGEIVSWKVKEGDALTEDQIMVEVMTDKATVEIGSPVTGSVLEIKAADGETVPVGSVIVVLAEGQGAADTSDDDAPKGDADKDADEDADEDADAEGGPAAKAPSKAPAKASAEKSKSAKSAKSAKATDDEAEDASADQGDEEPAAGEDDGDYEEINFALPDIGEGVAEGEVTQWHVKAGDMVKEDQVMVEVMTDKATVEIGSPVDGKVLELLVGEGETVPVGEILLVLGSTSGAPSMHAEAASKSASAPAAKSAASAKTPAASGGSATATLSDTGLPSRSGGDRRVRAAPATRRLARELGIEIGEVEGSGPQGRVTNEDVRRATQDGAPAPKAPAKPAPAKAAPKSADAAAGKPAGKPAEATAAKATAAKTPAKPAAAPAPKAAAPKPAALTGDERIPLRGLRKRIAKQMRISKDTAAHFTYVEEVDVTELVKLRKAAKAKGEAAGVNITYMPFLMKAIVPALREFPLVNSSLDEEAGEIVIHHDINIGVAVDTPDGLIVPVVRDVPSRSLIELAGDIGELAERGRQGKQKPEDFGGGTFTITNAGNIGGLLATPIINVPEVAILGVHAIRRKPWVVDDKIVQRDILLLSLSFDHRVVDGAVGARFCNKVKELLESPALLLLEEL